MSEVRFGMCAFYVVCGKRVAKTIVNQKKDFPSSDSLLYSLPSNAAFRRLMSSFSICHNAFNIRCFLSVSLAFNISPTNEGTICHEMPYLSLSQPHSRVSPPSANFSQNSSISSCVSHLTNKDIAGENW